MADILIIGAGAAGLSAAFSLRANGHNVSIVEAWNEIGGRAFSYQTDGVWFDWGAEAIEATDDAIAWNLKDAQALGLADGDHSLDNPPQGYINPQDPLPAAVDGADGQHYKLPFAANGVRGDPIDTRNAVTPGQSNTVEDNINAVHANFDGDASDDFYHSVNLQIGQTDENSILFRQAQFGTWPVFSDAVEVDAQLGSIRNFERANAENAGAEDRDDGNIDQMMGKRVQTWAANTHLSDLVTTSKPVVRVRNIANNKVSVDFKDGSNATYDAVLVTVPTDKVKGPNEAVGADDLQIDDLTLDDRILFRANPLGCYFKLLVSGLQGVRIPSPGNCVIATLERGYAYFWIYQDPSASHVYLHAAGETGRVMSDNHPLAAQVLLQSIKRLNNPDFNLTDNATAWVYDWCKEEYFGGAYSITLPGGWNTREGLRNFRRGRIYYAGEAASTRWYSQIAGAMESGTATAVRMHGDLG